MKFLIATLLIILATGCVSGGGYSRAADQYNNQRRADAAGWANIHRAEQSQASWSAHQNRARPSFGGYSD